MDKSLGSHLHLLSFLHNHTCPTPPPNPQKTFFLEFQLCIGWCEGRTGIIATFTFQRYHAIKYSCSNCITYQSFSILNLHARFISWFMPNTGNWWGCTVLWGHPEMRENYENYFTVQRTFVQDYRNLRYARISMLWSNESWESVDLYHMTV